MFGADSARVVRDADGVLIVGTYVFPEVFPSREPFRDDARIVHIDLDAYEIAKNFPVELGVVADPRAALGALAGELERRGPLTPRAPAAARPPVPAATDGDSLMERFVRELSAQAPADLAVFDEALTASGPIAAHLPAAAPGDFFQTRGGSLGVGIPGALGVKLAAPSCPSWASPATAAACTPSRRCGPRPATASTPSW
ncbi:hypothetical protein ACFQ3Z_03600 [Streptomyces nogalater]